MYPWTLNKGILSKKNKNKHKLQPKNMWLLVITVRFAYVNQISANKIFPPNTSVCVISC